MAVKIGDLKSILQRNADVMPDMDKIIEDIMAVDKPEPVDLTPEVESLKKQLSEKETEYSKNLADKEAEYKKLLEDKQGEYEKEVEKVKAEAQARIKKIFFEGDDSKPEAEPDKKPEPEPDKGDTVDDDDLYDLLYGNYAK